MKCAWQEFLHIVPLWMRSQVDAAGRTGLQELRLRLGQTPELIRKEGPAYLPGTVSAEDLAFTVNAASKYSPWAASTVADGYLTAPGGHRVGLCGSAVTENGSMRAIRQPTSLCLRVARDFPGIANAAPTAGSVLIIGRPGSGKTTLLRDLIRKRAETGRGSVAVVDERGELFPYAQGRSCFSPGCRTDILTGCGKPQGISVVLKTMSPACIAVDEITAGEDADALLQAAWCGVDLFATAHAANAEDLFSRAVYRPIVTNRLFGTLLVMEQDKSWREERMDVCK